MNQKKSYLLDWKRYISLARQTAAEGAVLLENKNQTLPIKAGEKVAVFGRSQLNYYKSGTGSGGLVNTIYTVGIMDALKGHENVSIDEELLDIYKEWIIDNPFAAGNGWGQEPWCQKEMPIDEKIVRKSANDSDIAIIIIGRTAGEDQDTKAEEGGFILTKTEEEMIARVTSIFKRTAVILNVGNIIDMKWVEKYQPGAVLYAWQGGCEGGNGIVDVLTGKVTPCGKLSDTIAKDITDYPSTAYFGDEFENHYTEDIYVGYRYFETVAPDKVLYPFGYGLSYTQFTCETVSFKEDVNSIILQVRVENIGKCHGKEVVQVYVSAPQGKLGKPSKVLCGFAKTKELQPRESEIIEIKCDRKSFSSYDDSGVTGHVSCFVLEAGCYVVTIGNSIKSNLVAGELEVSETVVVEQLAMALSPQKDFSRMVMQDGKMKLTTVKGNADGVKFLPCSIEYPEYTGDQGIRLSDVAAEKATMNEFLAQLSDDELIWMTRGEGMCSPKVTPGTAGAFGGVTEELKSFGIPIGCCADGPSGIRMDCGTKAFLMPNGTAMACGFNTKLIEALYEMAGLELRKNKIDLTLGPGMNIHRNPLNGRNFEYFSEDPYLTGKMAVAQLKGLYKNRVSGTIKHFAANNQEFSRSYANVVVSERAMREIYLKGFEMAVKEGNAISIMTMYGPINGIWAASNQELLTTILREQWGYKGLVMTDWWAMMNNELGAEPAKTNTAAMIRAQNDLYMVAIDSKSNSMNDDTKEGLKHGVITRKELLRSAENICVTLMQLSVMERFYNPKQADIIEKNQLEESPEDFSNIEYQEINGNTKLDISKIKSLRGRTETIGLNFRKQGRYRIEVDVKAEAMDWAQLPITVSFFVESFGTTLSGENKDWVTISHEIEVYDFPNHYLKIYFGQTGIVLGRIEMLLIEE